MRLNSYLARSFGFLSDSVALLRFISNKSGAEYGVTRLQKARLAMRVIRNNRKIGSLTIWQQHLLLIENIFRVPKSLSGDVVECGCYNGASAINLSLACALTNRRLLVCDSFEGLPEPRDDEKYDIHGHSDDYYLWMEGEFDSDGGLDGVKENVRRLGNIEICEFVKGYFKDTLKGIHTDSVVMVFEDADLASSVEDCLRYLWPKLADGCKFYSHEPWSINVVSLFYDRTWWKSTLDADPPGFWGSGYGVRWGLRPCGVGYAIKFNPEAIKKDGSRRRIEHIGSKRSL